MSQLTDEELMTAVSKGNLDSMSFLFERYHLRIFNFLCQMTNGDRDLSEDITQEVFYKAIKYKSTYHGGKFASWMFTIARNSLNNHHRKKKEKIDRLDDVAYKLSEVNNGKHDDLSHLSLMLNKLDDQDKELIVLNRLQEIKYDQLAEMMGSTAGAVKVKVHRAIKKLKTFYFQD
ncbi:RNA polymerase sigma factor [Spongiivirga citrea]|uniref:Sigma-70 family RNA polymerase sigma factor n=1 Tax=Spongiivirga citrea TaxID=1481457 RepID=A0A6M0CH53_9FLAO|nr:RNA polymerase sigma factor [Spongiivirga citrea]NER17165.1 sigma-70 family RNA polymerase sigma factor [Spongiivirga citrea]